MNAVESLIKKSQASASKSTKTQEEYYQYALKEQLMEDPQSLITNMSSAGLVNPATIDPRQVEIASKNIADHGMVQTQQRGASGAQSSVTSADLVEMSEKMLYMFTVIMLVTVIGGLCVSSLFVFCLVRKLNRERKLAALMEKASASGTGDSMNMTENNGAR